MVSPAVVHCRQPGSVDNRQWRLQPGGVKMDQVMRMKDVVKKIGLCRATIYAMISRGEFPRPIRIGERATGWRESELEAWLSNRTSARERSAPALPSGR
ncbi:AlpA family transcriptional regulator [Paraburkholderia phytofirmans]